MRRSRAVVLAGLLTTTAAISPAFAGPFFQYSLDTLIAVPADAANVQPGGAFTSFDISYFDPTTRTDYVADRSNAAVDVFGGGAFLGRTAPVFTGQAATTSVSGPDGVVSVGSQHVLFAGDGDSTLKSFNLTNAGLPASQKFTPLNTGGAFRVDEMAYSPATNLVLAANNADSPAFGTLVNATTGVAVASHIVVPGAVGLEQPVWNPATGSFFISVPQFGSSGPGGVAEINPDGSIGRLYDFSTMGITSCSPTGLALGGSGHLMVGCGNAGTQTIVLDPSGTGSILKTFTQVSGSDEIWYDPKSGNFYVTGSSVSGRVVDIIGDLALNVLQSIALPNVNAHSIAVDPGNGDIYVPLPGTTATATDTLCPLGCVAVFAAPEPGSLPVLMVGLTGLFGLALRRRVHRQSRRL